MFIPDFYTFLTHLSTSLSLSLLPLLLPHPSPSLPSPPLLSPTPLSGCPVHQLQLPRSWSVDSGQSCPQPDLDCPAGLPHHGLPFSQHSTVTSPGVCLWICKWFLCSHFSDATMVCVGGMCAHVCVCVCVCCVC